MEMFDEIVRSICSRNSLNLSSPFNRRQRLSGTVPAARNIISRKRFQLHSNEPQRKKI